MDSPTHLHWFKSTFSSTGTTCVEVAFAGETVLIRDSKFQPLSDNQPIISIPATLWPDFLRTVASHSHAENPELPRIEYHTNGDVSLHTPTTTLTYDLAEWTAFHTGITAHEFEPQPLTP